MQKLFLPTIVLVAISFVFTGKVAHATCIPNPCDNALQARPFSPLFCDQSIFDRPFFNNHLVGPNSRSRIQFYGWAKTGITVNHHGATTKYGPGPSAYGYNNRLNKDGSLGRPGMDDLSGNSYVLMLEQQTDWKLNQLWLGARRDLDDHFGWGFRTDFVYGTDLRYARNWGDRSLDYHWGSGDYFASFPSLFASLGTRELHVRVGKFPGSFAHEGLAAPREFFYTHALICYGRPLTVQGVSLEWNPKNSKWDFSAAWTTGVFNSFENPLNDSGLLWKMTYSFTPNAALSYRIFYNDRGARPGTDNLGQIDCFNTLIFTWRINDRWRYMGEIAYTDGKHYSSDGRAGSHAWGVNNHLIRTINDKLSVGLRGEYHFSHRSMFDNPGITGGEGGNLWQMTLAANYKVTPRTTFRPEIRYDRASYNNGFRPFGGSAENEDRHKGQLCGGVSFVVVF